MRNKLVLALGALLLVAAPAIATTVYEAIREVRRPSGGAQTWYRTGLDGTDTVDSTPVDPQTIQGFDTYLKVVVRGTDGSGAATACVVVTTGVSGTTQDAIAGVQTVTLTTHNLGDGYLAEPLYFAVGGEHYYDVRCVAVSSGTVDIQAMTCGASSVVAE